MALDLKNFNIRSVDKKKLGVLALAIFTGLLAMVLTNNYIEQTSLQKAEKLAGGFSSAETQKLLSRVETLENVSQELASRQAALAQAAQAQASKPSAAPVASSTSLGVKTPMGKRAITIMVDRINAVGGMISPGDHIDIIVHLTVPDANDPKTSKTLTLTLFQNISVIAVGTSTQGGEVPQNTAAIPITLALDPQEASLISFAQQHGNLQLVIRPPQETQAYVLPMATWETLSEYVRAVHGADAEINSTETRTTGPRIEVYRGGQ